MHFHSPVPRSGRFQQLRYAKSATDQDNGSLTLRVMVAEGGGDEPLADGLDDLVWWGDGLVHEQLPLREVCPSASGWSAGGW